MKKELELNAEKYMCGILRIKEIVEEYGVVYNKEPEIDFRIKSAASIADKLKKKGYAITFENAENYLNDLAGVRVICDCEKEVYEIDNFIAGREEVVIVRRKDYIKKPKKSGYKSLHLIAESEGVRVEIQIRTAAMHCWAEEDHRLCYKMKS